MKNKLTLVLVGLMAVLSVGFISCKKETIVKDDNGDPHNNGYSQVLYVNANQWTSTGDGTFTSSFSIPNELPWGKFVYGADLVLIYISSTDPSTGNGEEYPLMGNGTVLGNYSFYYGVSYDKSKNVGVVKLTAEPTSNNVTVAPNATLYFHTVYIQPYTANDAQSSKVNLNDYNSVKKVYNLKN